MTLAELPIGEKGTISGFSNATWEVVYHELGFSKNQAIEVLHRAPFKGPLAVKVGDSLISLRLDEASCVYLAGDNGQ